MNIRRAVSADGAAFVGLVRALATFERLPGPDDETARRLLADAFSGTPPYDLWVAEQDGEIVAYAVLLTTYSTFLARPSLYLEDLFVAPAARRRGIARAMLTRFAALAKERGCGRFEWLVLADNQPAIDFYRTLGAAVDPSWRLCRMEIEPE